MLAIFGARPPRFLLLANHIEQSLGRKRLSQERCTDRHRIHVFAGHDDNVHMRVSAAGVVGELST